MALKNIFDTHKILVDDKISFIYQGDFSDEMTDKILDLSEYNIESRKEVIKLKRKVSFLLAESFQNIVRHGIDEEDEPGSADSKGIFITRHIDPSFFITSGNLVQNDKIEQIKSMLEKVNSLNKDQLKELYVNIINTEELSSKGGAGVGMIAMARKSGQKLEYDFEPYNKDLSFYYMQIKLQSKENIGQGKHISLSVAKDLRKTLSSENISMIYKGDFSGESIMPVIQMLKANISGKIKGIDVKRKVVTMMVELLQNISIHGKKDNGFREGIFVFGEQDNKYFIGAGNLIDKNKVPALKKYLTELNNMAKDELLIAYKEKISQEIKDASTRAGLGLIDLAMDSDSKIQFAFNDVDDSSSFYSMSILV